MSIFSELKRRNVFKVAAAYIVVGWLILQVGEVLSPALRLPGAQPVRRDAGPGGPDLGEGR